MNTTLNAIRSHHPCAEGWAKLLKHLNKTQGDDEPLSLLTVLESNGLDDAIWCLRTEPQLAAEFAQDCADRVKHLKNNISASATRAAAYATRAAAYAADVAAYAADAAAYAAVAAADAAVAAADAAVAAVAAVAAADAAVAAADVAARAAADVAAADAAYTAERAAQVEIFKEIFA